MLLGPVPVPVPVPVRTPSKHTIEFRRLHVYGAYRAGGLDLAMPNGVLVVTSTAGSKFRQAVLGDQQFTLQRKGTPETPQRNVYTELNSRLV